MKNLITAFVLLLPLTGIAQSLETVESMPTQVLETVEVTQDDLEPWQQEVLMLEEKAANASNIDLYGYYTASLIYNTTTCVTGATIVIGSFIADSMPVINAASELMANATDKEYRSLESTTLWGKFTETVTGALGGAAYVALDTVEFFFLALAGEEDQAWSNVKAAYESTSVIYEKLDQDKGKCKRYQRAVQIFGDELTRRANEKAAAEEQ